MQRCWSVGAWLAAAVVGLPIAAVLWTLVTPAGESWRHLRATVLADYAANTLLLAAAVVVLAAVIGVATAWTVATKDFPGRGVLSWALVLPLAAPAYVVAYVYTDLLEHSGPVQTLLREAMGWRAGDYVFPPIRSLGGAALMLALVLYPYVYLLARSAFAAQAASLAEAARVLGAGPARAFWRVALPAARPAIAGGVALAGMEAVADFGVVEYFGVATFTTGIFRTWFALGDRAAAAQLAAWLFVVVAVLVLVEHYGRRGRFSNPVRRGAAAPLRRLTGGQALLAAGGCALPLLFGFALPALVLVRHAVKAGDPLWGRGFVDFVAASFGVATAAAVIATMLALALAYSVRLRRGRALGAAVRLATLGYALPGAVLAVGVLLPLTALDKWLARFLNARFDADVGLLLTGTAAALVFACVARFLAVAYNACHGGLEKIHRHLDEVAQTLGAAPRRVLGAVHVPLLGGAVASAALLVFVDVLKELPATLILRPFDFETLATRVYRLASDERLPEASTAALAIVLAGLLPAMLLGARDRAWRSHGGRSRRRAERGGRFRG